MLASVQLNHDREGVATNYLITWVCYGAWLPGQCGAVPRNRNRFGAPLPEEDARKEGQSKNRMTQGHYLLNSVRRQVVLKSLQEVCACRGWTLLAAHVRTNHVHVVVMANCKPDLVLNTMKSYSSRGLNEAALDSPDRRRWARHGSTRYLWTGDAVRAAIQYVVVGQGESMAVYESTVHTDAAPRSRSGF
jgi:REP element-mobilizing transposase RayT